MTYLINYKSSIVHVIKVQETVKSRENAINVKQATDTNSEQNASSINI